MTHSGKPTRPRGPTGPVPAIHIVAEQSIKLTRHLETMEKIARVPLNQIVKEQASHGLVQVIARTCEAMTELMARAQHDLEWLQERERYVAGLVSPPGPVVHGRVRPVPV